MILPIIEAIAKDLFRLLLFLDLLFMVLFYGLPRFSRAFYKGLLIKVSYFEVTIWSRFGHDLVTKEATSIFYNKIITSFQN